SIATAVTRMLSEFRDCWAYLVLVALATCIRKSEIPRKALTFPSMYLATSFIVMFARGKVGADSNYFLEWEAALCWCAGVGYSVLRSGPKISNWTKPAVPAMLAAYVLFFVAWVNLHRQLPTYRFLSGCRDAYQYVKNYPGDHFLSDNVGAV